jgi:hypothetical protein
MFPYFLTGLSSQSTFLFRIAPLDYLEKQTAKGPPVKRAFYLYLLLDAELL